jgi:hypothetical protein
MRRQHAGFAAGLCGREQQNPQQRAGRQGFDGRGLAVGRDDPFEFPPELIHRTELRRLFGQPDQFDVQPCGQRLRRGGGMRARAIEQQPDRARTAIAPSQFEKERAGVGATRSRPSEHDAVRRADVDRAEEHPFRVLARHRHHPRRAHWCPRRSQRWKEAEQRPVGDEDDVAAPDARPQATAESPFFCAR